ncbi:DUF4652 domain-containing protein [Paenibacillus nanensis]|nr:DUF4652 domain-containing protein [Paenibacillus nanensis]
MLRKMPLLCLLIISLLTGCSNDAGGSSSELILAETVFYPENEPPSIKVKRGEDWKEISAVDDYPSKPVISSDKTKLAFISPYEFELAGEAWLYDAQKDESKKLFSLDDAGDGNSVKQILWFDDDNLLILTGNTYGTISFNQNLYLLDLNEKEHQLLLQVQQNQDIRDLTIKEASISMNVATYNEDFTDYASETKVIEITEK